MDYLIATLQCFSPIILIILMGIVLIFNFISFDELVRIQHREFYSFWVDDGKPNGFFWHSDENSLFRSSSARNRLAFHWIYNTPKWARKSKHAMTLLRRLRISTSLWYAAILIILANSLLSAY